MKPSNSNETVAEYQAVTIKKKLEKFFDYSPDTPIKACPIKDILSPASDKWSILIILFLGSYQVLRFGDLKKNVLGISAKVLTERLRTLERDGYITREVFPEVPVRVEYKLSDFGLRYLDKLIYISEWIKEEMDHVLQSRVKFDKK